MERQKVIGIIGGGQLAKYLTLAAHPLGFKVIVLEPGEGCPAAQAGAEQIIAGLYDEKAIVQLASRCDYLTAEIEHLSTAALKKIAKKQQTKIRPSGQTIELIQDKLKQKQFFQEKCIPVGPFAPVETKADIQRLMKKYNSPLMLKSRLGAYNGLGNYLIKNDRDLDTAWKKFEGAKLYAEKIIPFKKELAVMGARDKKGNIALFPVVETVHKRNICIETLAPAQEPPTTLESVEVICRKVLKTLDDIGIFGIEMFLTNKNEILINEVAPRVHNSGHYTLDGCLVSQFDQHIRAICDLPLGDTELTVPACVMINVLGERSGKTRLRGLDKALGVPMTFVHIYGKSPTKIDRKMGHINSIGSTIDEARKRARKARSLIDI